MLFRFECAILSCKITNIRKFSKVKFDKSYSNSHGTLFRVNFALNVDNFSIFFFGIFLRLSTISSTLFTLLESDLTQSFVSLQSVTRL